MNWVELFRQMKAGLSLEHSVREEAEKALGKYPFFAMARMMVAKTATKEGDPRAHGLRFLAALYAPHRQYYAFFIGDRVRPMVAPPPRIGGQEGEAPRQTPSKQEEAPSSSDEPGPVEAMPFSPAYLPRLQGQLKARLHLYRGLSQRLRQAIRLPPLAPSPIVSETPPAVPAGEPSLQTPVSSAPASHLAELETNIPGEPMSSPPPEVELPAAPRHLSPFLLTLQFELSDKPPTPQAGFVSAPSEESALAAPSPLLEASGEVVPPPSAVESMESEVASVSGDALSEPISAFTRPYVPLENPEAPVSPSAAQTPAKPIVPEPISAFTRPYAPLEAPDAPVAPSKIQPLTQEQSERELPSDIFHSDHPIRLIVLPEFDPEASVHLKVPEPGPAPPEEVVRPVTPIPLGGAGSSSSEETSSEAPALPPSWQSFLSEIEQPLVQVAQEALSQTAHTLEKLRQAFIRYLLQTRKERRVVQEPPPPSTAIEEVLRLLETFQPKGQESPSPPPLMSVPEREAMAAPPPIYTETMARLCWSQGDLPLAIEIYQKLKTRYPEKAAHYEAQIARIQRGEQP